MQVHALARSSAYTDIYEYSYPSEYYRNSRFEVCKRLIALAGYRLADLLNKYL